MEWSNKNRNKFLHSEHQNELIKLMSLKNLRGIAQDINKSVFYAIMTDKVTNTVNNEQFAICFRSTDNFLEVHDDFIDLYTETLVEAIEYVLLRLSIPLENS